MKAYEYPGSLLVAACVGRINEKKEERGAKQKTATKKQWRRREVRTTSNQSNAKQARRQN